MLTFATPFNRGGQRSQQDSRVKGLKEFSKESLEESEKQLLLQPLSKERERS